MSGPHSERAPSKGGLRLLESRSSAEWLTASENREFARSVANRYVSYLLGRGLVEPVDDMRATNPPNVKTLSRQGFAVSPRPQHIFRPARNAAASSSVWVGLSLIVLSLVRNRCMVNIWVQSWHMSRLGAERHAKQ